MGRLPGQGRLKLIHRHWQDGEIFAPSRCWGGLRQARSASPGEPSGDRKDLPASGPQEGRGRPGVLAAGALRGAVKLAAAGTTAWVMLWRYWKAFSDKPPPPGQERCQAG